MLLGLVDKLARRLRGAQRVCRTVVLRLRFDDFSRATRSHTMPESTAQTQVLLAAARALLAVSMPVIQRQGISLIGVTFANLDDNAAVQLALPLDAHRATALDAAVDTVRDRYGSKAITRAALLGKDEGFTPPLLPD